MGLAFTHTGTPTDHRCPHWGYSGFNLFRERLATTEGFDLNDMQGYSQGHILDPQRIHGTRSWDEITSPLKPLLNHSDCDGHLTATECAQVAPRLREAIASWPPENGALDDDRDGGLELAACMEACAAAGVDLEFR